MSVVIILCFFHNTSGKPVAVVRYLFVSYQQSIQLHLHSNYLIHITSSYVLNTVLKQYNHMQIQSTNVYITP